MNWFVVEPSENGYPRCPCGERLAAGDVVLAITQGSRVFTNVYVHKMCVERLLPLAPLSDAELDARAARLPDIEAILCG